MHELVHLRGLNHDASHTGPNKPIAFLNICLFTSCQCRVSGLGSPTCFPSSALRVLHRQRIASHGPSSARMATTYKTAASRIRYIRLEPNRLRFSPYHLRDRHSHNLKSTTAPREPTNTIHHTSIFSSSSHISSTGSYRRLSTSSYPHVPSETEVPERWHPKYLDGETEGKITFLGWAAAIVILGVLCLMSVTVWKSVYRVRQS
jgi:hypothetical protein